MLAPTMKKTCPLLVSILLLASSAPAEEQIYRCGNTYSNNPCKGARKLERSVSRYTQPEYPKLLEEARARMATESYSKAQEDKGLEREAKKKVRETVDTSNNLVIRGAGVSLEELRNLAGIRAPSVDNDESSE